MFVTKTDKELLAYLSRVSLIVFTTANKTLNIE
jgi:hypothetical protein